MKANWVDITRFGIPYDEEVDLNAPPDSPRRYRHRERDLGDGRPYQHGRVSRIVDWKFGRAPDNRAGGADSTGGDHGR